MEGRAEALARAVRNLVDNAVKFSPGGPVEVVIDGGSVTVHDAGPGIPEADRERIFERFHRLEDDRDEPGSGLDWPSCAMWPKPTAARPGRRLAARGCRGRVADPRDRRVETGRGRTGIGSVLHGMCALCC